MTESLEQAFAAAAKLTDSEQNSFAAWITSELESERRCNSLFEGSQDELVELAREALNEHAAGETQDWN